MPKFCVKLRGAAVVRIEAATFEEVNAGSDDSPGHRDRVAKDADGKELGFFCGKGIVGRWIEQEASPEWLRDLSLPDADEIKRLSEYGEDSDKD